jgi:hypothetical protein
MEAAPKVAALMAKELGKDPEWEKKQVTSFLKIGACHLP